MSETTIDNLEDALSALKKARQDAATQRTKAKEAQEAQEALDALTAERDELASKLKEAEDITDALSDLIEEIQERAGIDLSALEKAETDDDVNKALDAAFKPIADLKAQADAAARDRTELTYVKAAGSEYDPVKLQKIAPGLTAREIEREGQKVTEYGIPGEGDAWTPLADAVSGWEASLKRDGTPAPKPAPAPLPTGGAGGKPAPSNPIQDRIKARQESQTAPTDPFKPGGNS